MALNTDWLMVIITAIYVVATIFIWLSNKKSADAAAPVYWCKLNRANGSTFRYNVKRPNPT